MQRFQFGSLTSVALSAAVACGLLMPASAAAAPELNEDGFLINGVTAHRGFPEAYPENTFQGYQAAIDLGADWIELDVFTTADGQLVVSHDETTGRFADRDLTISESTYAELAALDVAHSFREEHGLTEAEVPPARMPLLSEILEMVMQQDHTRASLQPKDESTEAAVEMVQDMNAQQWTGFNDGDLEKMSLVKELDPSIHVFWDLPATGNLEEEIAIATDRGFESLIANQDRISPEVIERIEAAGFESGAWTVNDTAVMKQFIDWGIDRLYTDSADQAMLLFGMDQREGLEHQLTGHWAMDDQGSATADDTGSPNPLRNGRVHGGAELTGTGHLNGAVQLNGSDGYVDVPFEVLPDTADQYTASAWFKPENIGEGAQTILESSGSGAISVELADGTGNLTYSVETTEQSVAAATDVAPSEGEWQHVAVTFDADSGDTAMYFNGEQLDSFEEAPQQAAGQLAATDGLHMGTNQSADGQFFAGQLDEVAVWNRVLGADELATLWNDGTGSAVPHSYEEASETPALWQPIYDGDVPGDYDQPEPEDEETPEPSEPEEEAESPEPEEEETQAPEEDEESPAPEDDDSAEPEGNESSAPENEDTSEPEAEETSEAEDEETPESSEPEEEEAESPEPDEGDIPVEAEIEGIDEDGNDGESTDPGALVLSVSEGTASLGNQRNAGDRLHLSGAMPSVTVTDTRQDANGWEVSGQASDLTSGDATLAADHLGWVPSILDDAEPAPGGTVASTLAGGEGLATPQQLGKANAETRMGSTELTADLNLEIPVDTETGTYEGAVSVSLFPVD